MISIAIQIYIAFKKGDLMFEYVIENVFKITGRGYILVALLMMKTPS